MSWSISIASSTPTRISTRPCSGYSASPRHAATWPPGPRPKQAGSPARPGTTVETRELRDIDARLRDMDELRIDVQVLYPTMFLGGFSSRAEVDLALTRSYNRWMAASTAKSGGRLRWVALMPMLSIGE